MNFIVSGFHYRSHFPILENILAAFMPGKVYIITDTEKVSVPSGIEHVFHYDQPVAINADYNVDFNTLLPLDSAILNQFSTCEVNALRMMDRYAVPDHDSYEHRKFLFLKHLRYWNHVFSTEKIDFAIFDNVPHQVYDYIVYEMCKIKKIPYLILYQSVAEDFAFFYSEIDVFNLDLKNKYATLMDSFKDTPENEISLETRSRSNLEFLLRERPVPVYMTEYFRQKTIGKWIKKWGYSFLHNNPIKVLRNYWNNILPPQKLSKFYDKIARIPDLSKKFVYLPLHFQPESSTCPMANVFVDQLLIVQLLHRYLPPDVDIYVKEHPVMSTSSRSREFYDALASIPRTTLVSRKINSFELIKNCVAVATATGTAGWEALFKGKPVMLFGTNFYEYSKGVFKIQTNQDCQNAVENIFNKNIKPCLKDMLIYYKAMEETSFNGYIGAYYQRISHLSLEENVRNCSKAIIEKMHSLLDH